MESNTMAVTPKTLYEYLWLNYIVIRWMPKCISIYLILNFFVTICRGRGSS